MKDELYHRLVDLYAGHELPKELEEEMELAAYGDPELSHDMATLRRTVDRLKNTPQPEFTEESYQRILMKILSRGVDIQTPAPIPSHMQYHLPIQG
jgi:hypothetical protein